MSKTIVVADDQPGIISGVQFALEDEDVVIIKASDGREAWSKVSSIKPDLVILDSMMPPSGKYEGIEICKRIKNDPDTKSIPVIMLTALGSKRDQEMAIEAGALDCVEKPFNSDALARKVKDIIG